MNELNAAIIDIAGPTPAMRIIPQGTFTVTEEIPRGRFRTYLSIRGPWADYTDAEILLHFGGDARFGDTVQRFLDGVAWIKVWSD